MHTDEALRFVEELARDGYEGESIDSVRVGGLDEEVFSEN